MSDAPPYPALAGAEDPLAGIDFRTVHVASPLLAILFVAAGF